MINERRKEIRIDLKGDYFFFPDNRSNKIPCSLLNISATGACIVSTETLKSDIVIFLHIRGKKNIILKSEVVWKIDSQYGLKFFLETPEDLVNISYIMNYGIEGPSI
jgi:hypothetical protein